MHVYVYVVLSAEMCGYVCFSAILGSSMLEFYNNEYLPGIHYVYTYIPKIHVHIQKCTSVYMYVYI